MLRQGTWVAEIKANVARFVAGEPLTNLVRAGR
jgi:hypothetical protein